MKKADWNEIAREYNNQFNPETDWRLGYPIVTEVLGNIIGRRVLDLGCGSGKFTRILRDLGAIVTAVDISENAIERARQGDTTNIDYKTIEDDDISFLENDSIDHAITTFVLCTMQNEYQIRDVVKQIYDKLKPNGSFVILEPHPEAPGYEFVSYVSREIPQERKSGTPVKVRLRGMDTSFYDYWKSKEFYIEVLTGTGFVIAEMREPTIEEHLEEICWKDERIQPPLLTICAKK